MKLCIQGPYLSSISESLPGITLKVKLGLDTTGPRVIDEASTLTLSNEKHERKRVRRHYSTLSAAK